MLHSILVPWAEPELAVGEQQKHHVGAVAVIGLHYMTAP